MREQTGLSWNLRRYRDGDEEAIVELLGTAFGRWHNLEYWEWKYTRNPAGPPIIWLAEHNGKLIGHYAIIPMRMKVGNIRTIGSFACNAATHPKYQGKGVFSSLVNRCCSDAAENNIALTYGFANVHLGPTYKRYEWRGHICYMDHMIKVEDWAPTLSRYLRSRSLVRAGARLLGAAFRCGNGDEGLKIERITRFDERFNRFWEEISKNFGIIVERDQRYLNWRYVDHPKNEHIIYTAVDDDRILGYCVLREVQHKRLRLGLIMDILGFRTADDCDVIHQLIRWALKRFTEHGVARISCLMSENHPFRLLFRKAGFLRHPTRNRALYATVNLAGSSLSERETYSQALILSQNRFFKQKRDWFMMFGDGNIWE